MKSYSKMMCCGICCKALLKCARNRLNLHRFTIYLAHQLDLNSLFYEKIK